MPGLGTIYAIYIVVYSNWISSVTMVSFDYLWLTCYMDRQAPLIVLVMIRVKRYEIEWNRE